MVCVIYVVMYCKSVSGHTSIPLLFAIIGTGVLLCRLARAIDAGEAQYRYETQRTGPSGRVIKFHENAGLSSLQCVLM